MRRPDCKTSTRDALRFDAASSPGTKKRARPAASDAQAKRRQSGKRAGTAWGIARSTANAAQTDRHRSSHFIYPLNVRTAPSVSGGVQKQATSLLRTRINSDISEEVRTPSTKMSAVKLAIFSLATSMWCLGLARDVPNDPSASTRAALERLIERLEQDKARAKLVQSFDGKRTAWRFVPGVRSGLARSEFPAPIARSESEVLGSVLSPTGVRRFSRIRALEAILRDRESRPGKPALHRDPMRYYATVWGKPSAQEPWAWRYEGHHLSLNVTVIGSELAVTPYFLGANPAVVPTRHATAALGAHIKEALYFLETLSAEDREAAVIAEQAPRDVLFGPARKRWDKAAVGIAYLDMKPRARRQLLRLIRVYLRDFAPPIRTGLEERYLSKPERIHFGWAGTSPADALRKGFQKPDGIGPHYYRIQGPRFVIEFDNFQNRANHAHCLLRDLERDFGRDLLAEHAKHAHGRGK